MFGWKMRLMKPIDGDLKGYFSGKSTRTFHTPPSYGAAKDGDFTFNTIHSKLI